MKNTPYPWFSTFWMPVKDYTVNHLVSLLKITGEGGSKRTPQKTPHRCLWHEKDTVSC